MRPFAAGVLLALACALGGVGLSQAKADPIPVPVVSPCDVPAAHPSSTPVAYRGYHQHRFPFWRHHRHYWRHGC